MWTEEEMKESYRQTYEEMNRFDSLEDYLKFLEEEKKIMNTNKIFKIHCFECQTTFEKGYEKAEDVPDVKECPNCSARINKDMNTILITKSYKEQYEDGEIDFFALLCDYKLKNRAIEALSKEISEIKEILVEIVKNEGKPFGTGSQKIISGNQEIIVQSRKNLKSLSGAINFLRQQGHMDCLEESIKINNKQIWKKWENGIFDNKIFSEFFEISYTDVFNIKNIK